MSGDTLVNVAPDTWKRAADFKVGDQVLALAADGSWKNAPVVGVAATGSPDRPYHYAIYVDLENGTTLIVTPDHLFLQSDKTLKRADRLAPSDKLFLASTGAAVGVKQALAGTYYGEMWNISVTDEVSPTRIEGHLINTAGVVSADWLLQRARAEQLIAGPQIGTQAYRDQHKAALQLQSAVPDEIVISKDRGLRFLPFKPIPLPEKHVHLLPDGEDIPKQAELYPLDYSVPYEMADYLVRQYRTFYPGVSYSIDWTNDRVNAVAGIDGSGRRYVILYGGLLRHHRVQVEGAGLVISHELGHHYAGAPTYPNSPLSCEGQADYWGARIAQRRVWWGEYSFEQTSKGATQLRDLFQNGLMMNPQKASSVGAAAGICSHPPAQCRYDTYMAGMRLQPKPSCAGN